LSQQGVPLKHVSLLKALHKLVKVKFIVDGVEKAIDSIIGVNQGDVLGPDVFIFFIATIMTPWRSFYSYNLYVVRCKADSQLTGRRPMTKVDLEIKVSDSEYANDTTFTFESREDCEKITYLIVKHFSRWGLESHVGFEDNASKSKILSAQNKILGVMQIQLIMMS
jgi:hypothetical protein